MSNNLIKIKNQWKENALLNKDEYEKLYKESIENPESFWAEQAKCIDWFTPFSKNSIKKVNFSKNNLEIKWFYDGKLNISYNCIDRHLEKKGDQTAIIWEGDDPQESKHISYKELHAEVCLMANVLKSKGIKKGDRITIYMPMIPEATYAMLACARIGAIHSVVFGGFSPDSIADRIIDCKSDYVITADEGYRAGKIIPLKNNVDIALKRCPNVKNVLVIKRTGNQINMFPNRDVWWHEEKLKVSKD